MTEAERLIERLKTQAQQASQLSKTMAEDKSLRQSGNTYLRTDLYMWPQPENTLEGQAATLIQQQADRIAALEGAFDEVIATIAAVRAQSRTDEWAESADHFYKLCGDELRKARAVLGETSNAK